MKTEDLEKSLPLPSKGTRRRTWHIVWTTLALSWLLLFSIVLTGQVAGSGILAMAMVALIITSIVAWVGGAAWDYRVFKDIFSIRADVLSAGFPPAPTPAPVSAAEKAKEEELPPAGPGMSDERETSK